MRASPARSVAWEATRHVLIEGESPGILRLLRPGYRGRVKLLVLALPAAAAPAATAAHLRLARLLLRPADGLLLLTTTVAGPGPRALLSRVLGDGYRVEELPGQAAPAARRLLAAPHPVARGWPPAALLPTPLPRLVSRLTGGTDLVAGFGGTNAPLAHAVWQANAHDGAARRLLLGQPPAAPDELPRQARLVRAGRRTGPAPDLGFRHYALVPAAPAHPTAPPDPARLLAALLLRLVEGGELPLSARVRVRQVAGVEVYELCDGLLWLATTAVSDALWPAALAARPARVFVAAPLLASDAAQRVRQRLALAGIALQLV